MVGRGESRGEGRDASDHKGEGGWRDLKKVLEHEQVLTRMTPGMVWCSAERGSEV